MREFFADCASQTRRYNERKLIGCLKPAAGSGGSAMPVHDWTRVSAGTFHDFHCTWVPEIKNRLNNGVLPADYYAQVEQALGGATADVLTLRTEQTNGSAGSEFSNGGTA